MTFELLNFLKSENGGNVLLQDLNFKINSGSLNFIDDKKSNSTQLYRIVIDFKERGIYQHNSCFQANILFQQSFTSISIIDSLFLEFYKGMGILNFSSIKKIYIKGLKLDNNRAEKGKSLLCFSKIVFIDILK